MPVLPPPGGPNAAPHLRASPRSGQLTDLSVLVRRWFKVKIKSADASAPPQIGLVPASYLTAPEPLKQVVALFDYAPARAEDGSLENDEELEIVEGEQLALFEDEGDWVLVQRAGGKGVGFVPGTYVEVSAQG